MIELRMTDRRVLVQMELQIETVTESGVIAVQSHDPGVIGTVISVGPSVRDVKEGDVVVFSPCAGTAMAMGGDEYLVLHEDEIEATWDSDDEPI